MAPLSVIRPDGYTATVGREALVVDGLSDTFWQSAPVAEGERMEVVLRLGGGIRRIRTLRYQPRQDGNLEGTVSEFEVYLSGSPDCWGVPVKQGTFAEDDSVKTVIFGDDAVGAYLRFVVTSAVGGTTWSAAEFEVDVAAGFEDDPPDYAIAGDVYRHQLAATLGAGNPAEIVYELIEGPVGLTVSAGGTVEWTPRATLSPGEQTIEVLARSPRGSASKTFSIQLMVPRTVASAQIGPEGGTLKIADSGTVLDGVTVSVPAGALAQAQTVTVSVVDEIPYSLWDEAVVLGPGLVIRPQLETAVQVRFPSGFPMAAGYTPDDFYLAGWAGRALFQDPSTQPSVVPYEQLPSSDRDYLFGYVAAIGLAIPVNTKFLQAQSSHATVLWALDSAEDRDAVAAGIALLGEHLDELRTRYITERGCNPPEDARIYVLGVGKPFVLPSDSFTWMVLNKRTQDARVESFAGLRETPPVLSVNNRVALAHEYFHVIQTSIDPIGHGWFAEATAVFEEDELFDGENYYRERYAPWGFGPIAFHYAAGSRSRDYYQSALFFKYLKSIGTFNSCSFYEQHTDAIEVGALAGNVSFALDAHLKHQFPQHHARFTAAYLAQPLRRDIFIEEIEHLDVSLGIEPPKFEVDCEETQIMDGMWLGSLVGIVDLAPDSDDKVFFESEFVNPDGEGSALGVVLDNDLNVLGTLSEERPELELEGAPSRMYVSFVSVPEGPEVRVSLTARACDYVEISGRVTDAVGLPVPNALVSISHGSAENLTQETFADSEGFYSDRVLAPKGKLELTSSCEGNESNRVGSILDPSAGDPGGTIDNVDLEYPDRCCPQCFKFKVLSDGQDVTIDSRNTFFQVQAEYLLNNSTIKQTRIRFLDDVDLSDPDRGIIGWKESFPINDITHFYHNGYWYLLPPEGSDSFFITYSIDYAHDDGTDQYNCFYPGTGYQSVVPDRSTILREKRYHYPVGEYELTLPCPIQ